MDIQRTDINVSNSKDNLIYIILTAVLIILSIVSVILFILIIKNKNPQSVTQIPETVIPTTAPTRITPPKPTLVPAAAKVPTSSTTLKPSLVPTITATASADTLTYESKTDGFVISYNKTRTLYQNQESYGNRYTFYSPNGNFVVHAGTAWSWSYPQRLLSNENLIDGKPSFRLDVPLQTIVDIQNNNTYYSLQCIHKNSAVLKTECESFIKSFNIL